MYMYIYIYIYIYIYTHTYRVCLFGFRVALPMQNPG